MGAKYCFCIEEDGKVRSVNGTDCKSKYRLTDRQNVFMCIPYKSNGSITDVHTYIPSPLTNTRVTLSPFTQILTNAQLLTEAANIFVWTRKVATGVLVDPAIA